MLRNDDEIHAEAIGDTKDRAEILRIGDAVEDQHESRRVVCNDIIEIGEPRRRNLRDDSVVHAARGESIDLLARHLPHRNARALCFADQSLMPRRLLAGDADVTHAIGMRANRLENGIDAVNDHARANFRGSAGPP